MLKQKEGKSKRETIKDLMSHHSSLFDKEKQATPKYIPRLCYAHKGDKIIGFYPSEIKGGQDIYVEFCDRNLLPEDADRTLYKWTYNPHYEEEYAKSDPHPSTGDQRYLIPIDELLVVKNLHKEVKTYELEEEKPKVDEFEEIPVNIDAPYADMTIRDYMAIQWKKPVSNKKWLNDLITKKSK